MDIAFVILAILVGIILIIVEIIFVPGTTIVGIFGLIILGVGIYFTYDTYGKTIGHSVLVGSAVVTVILLVYSFKSGTWLWLANDQVIDSKVTQKNQEKLKIGDIGESVSALRPMGIGMINNSHFEIESQGNFIDPKSEIRILELKNNRIIVESTKNKKS